MKKIFALLALTMFCLKIVLSQNVHYNDSILIDKLFKQLKDTCDIPTVDHYLETFSQHDEYEKTLFLFNGISKCIMEHGKGMEIYKFEELLFQDFPRQFRQYVKNDSIYDWIILQNADFFPSLVFVKLRDYFSKNKILFCKGWKIINLKSDGRIKHYTLCFFNKSGDCFHNVKVLIDSKEAKVTDLLNVKDESIIFHL